MGLILYAIIAGDRIIIKTNGQITTGQTQDMYMYLYCRANELVEFCGHEVKGQRCTHVCEK